MNKLTTISITIILLVSLILIGITTASVLTDSNTSFTEETNLDKITNEVINEISTYIQIKDLKGKFYEIDGESRDYLYTPQQIYEGVSKDFGKVSFMTPEFIERVKEKFKSKKTRLEYLLSKRKQ